MWAFDNPTPGFPFPGGRASGSPRWLEVAKGGQWKSVEGLNAKRAGRTRPHVCLQGPGGLRFWPRSIGTPPPLRRQSSGTAKPLIFQLPQPSFPPLPPPFPTGPVLLSLGPPPPGGLVEGGGWWAVGAVLISLSHHRLPIWLHNGSLRERRAVALFHVSDFGSCSCHLWFPIYCEPLPKLAIQIDARKRRTIYHSTWDAVESSRMRSNVKKRLEYFLFTTLKLCKGQTHD